MVAPVDNRCEARAVVHDRRFSPVQCDREAGHAGRHLAERRAKDAHVRWQWRDEESILTWVPRARALEPSLARKLLKRILG